MNGRASFSFCRSFGQAVQARGQRRWALLLMAGALGLVQETLPSPGRAEAPTLAGAPGSELRLEAAVVQGTNLWLAIAGAEPGGLYDLFSTTNLNADARWRFEMRSALPGQTGFVAPQVSLPACWFQLGTLLDSDGDFLTDAFEGLVLKTNPQLSDSDQDAVSDYVEFLQGRNPLAGAVADGQDAVRLRVFTPMP